MFGKKRNKTEKVKINSEILKSNEKAVEVLIEMVSTNQEISEKLQKLQEDIRFASPSAKPEILKADQKIFDKLGDLKIELGKASRRKNYDGITAMIDDIKLTLTERNSKL